MQGPSLAAALSSCSLSQTLKPLSQRNTVSSAQARAAGHRDSSLASALASGRAP